MDPDDPRHRLSGYPAHGSGQSPSPASQNYVTPSYGNEPRYGTQVGNAGLANPLLFGTAQPQTGPPSQSRPITLQELEKMTLAQRGAANQSVSSQFAGNSLFGGGGDFTQGHGYVGQASQHGQVGQGQHAQQIPVRETQQLIGGGPSMGEFAGQRQGGGQPSLFGDPLSFFQGWPHREVGPLACRQ